MGDDIAVGYMFAIAVGSSMKRSFLGCEPIFHELFEDLDQILISHPLINLKVDLLDPLLTFTPGICSIA
jgi:hypothetical protein